MSGLPFELMLALRYLRPKRTFVSVITLISIIGVMLGVAVLIIVISVMSGFDQELRDKIIGFNAHLRVTTSKNRVQNFREMAATIAQNPQVRGVAPYIIGQVPIEVENPAGDSLFQAVYLRGIDPALEGKVSVLPKSVVEGSFNLKGNRILVGSKLAQSLGLSAGDKISIYSPRDLRRMKESRRKKTEEDFLPDEYEVGGLFDVGYYEYNNAFIVTSLGNAQDLYDLGDSVHGLMVMLRDPYKADQVRGELDRLLRGDIRIITWTMENSTFLNALRVEKNVMFYLLFFIMIVAAFGITSALITFVVQKTREIGMLKALGATGRQIVWIFLSQSLLVGCLGVLLGFGLGMLAVSYRNEFLRVMNRMTGFQLFPAEIYGFTELPAVVDFSDILLICGGSLVICVLAGLIPAWNAGRLRPVEALRHE